MKNLFLLLLLFAFDSFSQSQFVGDALDPMRSGALFRTKPDDNKAVQGSPYTNKNFTNAVLPNLSGSLPMRYNAVKDEIEVQLAPDSIFAVPMKKEFSPIKIASNNYFLCNYTDDKNEKTTGYLVEVYQNKLGLFKKERIVFYPAKEAIGSYDVPKSARFEKVDDHFYIYNQKEIVIFPKNKKGLISLFPENEQPITQFLSKNKVNFSNEDDMKKIIVFLESL